MKVSADASIQRIYFLSLFIHVRAAVVLNHIAY